MTRPAKQCEASGCPESTSGNPNVKWCHTHSHARRILARRVYEFRHRAGVGRDGWGTLQDVIDDIGYVPGPGFRLTRIDRSKPLSKGNIRWVKPLAITVRYCQDFAEYRRQRSRLRLYDMEDHTYRALKDAQGGVCAICSGPQRKLNSCSGADLCVDHDHDAKVVRGLLCDPCNLGLGHFGDKAELLFSAGIYLAQGNATKIRQAIAQLTAALSALEVPAQEAA